MRKRAGGLYLRDKSLFLICEGNKDRFWTPGGGLEEGEDFEDALASELREEVEAKLTSADDEKITLEWQAREPKKIGKGKETVEKKLELPYENIKEAIVIISF